jgi:hypothetical protein
VKYQFFFPLLSFAIVIGFLHVQKDEAKSNQMRLLNELVQITHDLEGDISPVVELIRERQKYACRNGKETQIKEACVPLKDRSQIPVPSSSMSFQLDTSGIFQNYLETYHRLCYLEKRMESLPAPVRDRNRIAVLENAKIAYGMQGSVDLEFKAFYKMKYFSERWEVIVLTDKGTYPVNEVPIRSKNRFGQVQILAENKITGETYEIQCH